MADEPLSPPQSPDATPEELSSLSPFAILRNADVQREEASGVPPVLAPVQPAQLPPELIPSAVPPTLPPLPPPPLPPPLAPEPNREEILRQAAAAAPVAPVVPQPPPSRDELLRQAAAAPDTRLILPPVPALATEESPAAAITKISPEKPRPVVAMPTPPVPAPIPTPDIEVVRPHHRSGSGTKLVAGVLGVILALAILLGSAYALAEKGVRVPLLYAYVSKLQANGLDERDAASAYASAQGSYELGATSKVVLHLVSASTSATAAGGATNPFASATNAIPYARYVVDKDTLQARTTVTAGGVQQVPMVYETGSNVWQATFPLAATPGNFTVAASKIKETLLQSLLDPVSVQEMLGAATAETAYSPLTVNGAKTGEYTYSLDAGKLSAYLPSGASLTGATGILRVAWGSRQPLYAEVDGTIAYEQTKYQYQSVDDITSWNQPLPMSETGITGLGAGATALDIKDFIAQLGITYSTLPNGLTTTPTPTATPVATPSPTPSPTPTLAPPSSTPTPLTALQPSGQSTTVLLPAITATPPAPAATANAAAIARDTQRKGDLQLLQQALENYKTVKGSYPKSNGLEQVQNSSTLLNALVPTYLTALPIDPTQTTYWYEYQSDGTTYALRSVAENAADPTAKLGTAYHYYEFDNK
jgi:type II secretory pathway pseudopilin PulG